MNRHDLANRVSAYIPYNEQEERDKALILRALQEDDVLTRENTIAHLTASAWIVNKRHDRVLMCYHNIYHSWSWLGGHADGEADLLRVALKEAKEESGLKNITPVSSDIYSLEVLNVEGHIKKGKYVSSHLHLNLTYLLEADEMESLECCPEENSDVSWFELKEALYRSTEPWMTERIYAKLNEKLTGYPVGVE